MDLVGNRLSRKPGWGFAWVIGRQPKLQNWIGYMKSHVSATATLASGRCVWETSAEKLLRAVERISECIMITAQQIGKGKHGDNNKMPPTWSSVSVCCGCMLMTPSAVMTTHTHTHKAPFPKSESEKKKKNCCQAARGWKKKDPAWVSWINCSLHISIHLSVSLDCLDRRLKVTTARKKKRSYKCRSWHFQVSQFLGLFRAIRQSFCPLQFFFCSKF